VSAWTTHGATKAAANTILARIFMRNSPCLVIKKKLTAAEKEIGNLIDAMASYGLRDNVDIQRRLKQATETRD
jgi:hypothetical protein